MGYLVAMLFTLVGLALLIRPRCLAVPRQPMEDFHFNDNLAGAKDSRV